IVNQHNRPLQRLVALVTGNGGSWMASTPTEMQTRQVPQVTSAQKRSRISNALEKKENIAGYLFLLPWFLGLVVFMAGPVLSSLYLSFTNYNLIGIPQWLGLQNYIDMFHDAQWLDAVKVTLLYVVFSV